MIKALLVLVIAFILYSCTTTARYTIISDQQLTENITMGEKLKSRVVVVPYFKSELPKDFTEEDKILFQTSELIKKSSWEQITSLHTQKYANNELLPFCKGLTLFFQEDYLKALRNLNQYKGEKYRCLKDLLILDCYYELNLPIANPSGLIGEYQKVSDCNQNEAMQNMLEVRLKLYKYEK